MTVVASLPATRRHMLAGAALLGSGLGGAGGVAERSTSDAGLLAAAAAFCNLERRMLGLIDGPGRVADDGARDLLLAPLRDEQAPHLDQLCRERARSLGGHRARAMAFALWDGGELAERAGAQGLLADRLLAAVVRDLANMPC